MQGTKRQPQYPRVCPVVVAVQRLIVGITRATVRAGPGVAFAAGLDVMAGEVPHRSTGVHRVTVLVPVDVELAGSV